MPRARGAMRGRSSGAARAPMAATERKESWKLASNNADGSHIR